MDLKVSLLNFISSMIFIIHKILLLIKNHVNYLEDNIFEFVFKKYNQFFFKKSNFFYNI